MQCLIQVLSDQEKKTVQGGGDADAVQKGRRKWSAYTLPTYMDNTPGIFNPTAFLTNTSHSYTNGFIMEELPTAFLLTSYIMRG